MGRVGLPGGERARHSDLRGRDADFRGGREAAHLRDRCGHRREDLGVRRARDLPLGVLDAEEPREGCRVRGDRRPGRRLPGESGLLPARAVGRYRGACGGLRRACRRGRVPGLRRRRFARGAGPRVRPVRRHPARDGLHHEFLTGDRRQRRDRGRELRRAGLQPVAPRERPGRHPRLRRADGRLQVEVQRPPGPGRVRARDVGERCLVVDGRHLLVGAAVGG